MNYQNNMNELKYELFKLALSKSEDEIKNAVDVTKNLLVFLEIENPVEVKNQRPIIDVINEKIESDKTLKDPLAKEYTRHRLISDYINNELKDPDHNDCCRIIAAESLEGVKRIKLDYKNCSVERTGFKSIPSTPENC